MKISEFYELSGNKERAKKYRGTPQDIDVIAFLNKQASDCEREKSAAIRERAYTTAQISQPFMPGFSIDYNDGTNFVADLVSPVVNTNHPARKYPVWSRADANNVADGKMTRFGQPNRIDVSVGEATYQETPYGFESEIANADIADAADLPGLFQHHARTLMGYIKRAREQRVLTQLMTAANFATGCTSALSSTNRWDVGPSTSTANPVQDVLVTAATAVGLARPFNTLLIGKLAHGYLRTHPKVLAEAGATTDARVASDDAIARLFGVSRVIVADAKYNSAGNSATASYAYMAPKSVSLIYVQPGASREELSFAKTFRHHPIKFEVIIDRRRGIDGVQILKVTHADAEKIVASDSGYCLDTVIS